MHDGHTACKTVVVNGIDHTIAASDARTLLDYLRDELHLTGAKHGCDRGECGACAVLVDGRAKPSCLTLTANIQGEVTTIEGLAEDITDIRAAFADLGAFQCGYCTPGQLVAAEACLRAGKADSDTSIRFEMQGNVCRCTGYSQIMAAITRVANERHRREHQ
ncbi:(2Fe-2S)-binding protein [Mycobacterium sp. AZCC_0083]|uniref:(2Fe-2S)-binding protein n=1 Tax=Mycobacterium sp. AZCC_0083 TaxID=2735882 RepID=UPI001622EC11|nr:(2Fe-2S)-binding protein [Mycobacterium sp. AZCC_0083]MBB5167524.1 aerobic-type carbon monoxide dehydrogenase small subunit (CoxS/CutS family) [Mycobacterium sp. AZCC_0083]